MHLIVSACVKKEKKEIENSCYDASAIYNEVVVQVNKVVQIIKSLWLVSYIIYLVVNKIF